MMPRQRPGAHRGGTTCKAALDASPSRSSRSSRSKMGAVSAACPARWRTGLRPSLSTSTSLGVAAASSIQHTGGDSTSTSRSCWSTGGKPREPTCLPPLPPLRAWPLWPTRDPRRRGGQRRIGGMEKRFISSRRILQTSSW